MRITLEHMPGFSYQVGISRCPINVRIGTDHPVMIDKRIIVRGALLEKSDDPETVYGHARSPFRIRHDFSPFLPDEEMVIEINVLEYDESPILHPGTYQCSISVLIYEEVDRRLVVADLTGTTRVILRG